MESLSAKSVLPSQRPHYSYSERDVVTLFSTFFYLKTLHGPHMNRQKRFREIFRVLEDIRENKKGQKI